MVGPEVIVVPLETQVSAGAAQYVEARCWAVSVEHSLIRNDHHSPSRMLVNLQTDLAPVYLVLSSLALIGWAVQALVLRLSAMFLVNFAFDLTGKLSLVLRKQLDLSQW
jgi:hypothetical protein